MRSKVNAKDMIKEFLFSDKAAKNFQMLTIRKMQLKIIQAKLKWLPPR